MLTVSIGISAYNEAENICQLLKSILAQVGQFTLLEIIVVSDGSTDNTVKRIQSIVDNRIIINIHKKRQGKIQRFNEIAKRAKADILIMFDADVILTTNNFIDNIIDPIRKNKKIGLVGADTISSTPKTFFEQVITNSHECKNMIYKKINNGNNLYLCHGRARAFRKELYTQMTWLNDFP